MENWTILIKSKKELSKYKDEIIKEYLDGKTYNELAREYSTHSMTIKYVLLDNNVQLRSTKAEVSMDFLRKESEKIKDLYLNEHKSPKEIGEIYSVKRNRINYLLHELGVQKNQSEVKRLYEYDEDFFNCIDTPNKAYILGFWYADGNVSRVNNSAVLALQESDEDTLEKIREAIGSTKPLYHKNYLHPDGIERRIVSLVLNGDKTCSNFEKWGCPPAKTFLIDFPNFLSDDLYSHFIRGYFDGDGCACVLSDGGFTVSIMSSTQFCLGLQKYLLEKQEIKFMVNQPTGKKEGNKIIRSHSKKECKKFMDFIYKDADLYMKRKKDKFKEYFEKDC